MVMESLELQGRTGLLLQELPRSAHHCPVAVCCFVVCRCCCIMRLHLSKWYGHFGRMDKS
jgi:hypothetical protein